MRRRIAGLALAAGGVIAACSEPFSSNKSDQVTVGDCSSTSAVSMGTVAPNLGGTAVCVGGGSSGAEYVLIPFFADTVAAHTTTFQVTPTGTRATTAALDQAPQTAPFRAAIVRSSESFPMPDVGFETRLRQRERSLMTRFGPAARAWQAAGAEQDGPRFDVIPSTVTVGQILTLNTNADSDCVAPKYRGARVVAITNKAIVVADTGNPAGGYTDAEYQSLGVTFDTLIDPLDEQNFGAPSDIDHNSRILILFTKTVNDLTPPGSSSYIGGFFYARDLFPIQSTTPGMACPASNQGEMFYMMVPDPTRGSAFSKSNVSNVAQGTLAHEYQHLINASRRLYVNNDATDFEVVWLNEGLSHIAEELLFYRVSGISPRQNLTVDSLQATAARTNAFNNFEESNAIRYEKALLQTTKFGPYSDNDSLATRGATWSFLRYAADHRGTSDGDIWYRLVNTTTTGLPNLINVLGSGVENEIRDWQTSKVADDLAGAASTYQQPSWNMRSVLPALFSGAYPLATASLASTQSVTLVAGSSAYLRFAVPANATAQITWSGASSSIQMTLVRTR